MSELELEEKVVAKKAKKEVTAEEVAAIQQAVQTLSQAGILPEKFVKALSLTPKWHDSEANKEVKDEVIEYFGGSAEFKNYVESEEFQTALATLQGFGKVSTNMNLVKTFYGRRVTKRQSKATVVVLIDQTPYSVNKAYYNEIIGMSDKEELKRLLIEHKDTKVNEAIDSI